MSEDKMAQDICAECNLPIAACNAFAMYQKAIDYYRRGKSVEGDQFAESAKEFYNSYMAGFGDAGQAT